MFRVQDSFGLGNLRVLIPDSRQWTLLAHSLWVAGGAAALALLLGLPYGFLVSQAKIPVRGLFQLLGLLPLLVPPLIAAIAWSGLCGIQGPWGAIAVFGFSYFPFVWILSARAFERVDRRMEEAAILAGGWRAVARIELPFVLPSAAIGALLVFVFAIADFAVPDYLSTVGPKFSVYADDVFFRWKQADATGEAIAASIPPLFLISLALLTVLRLRQRHGHSLGAGFLPPQPVALGKLQVPAIAFLLLVLGATLFAPLGRLAYEAGGLSSYADALGEAHVDLGTSILLACAAALLATALQTLPALRAAHARSGVGMDLGILLPLALPGVLISIGFIRFWNREGFVFDWSDWVYGTKAVVLLLFLARFSAFPFFAGTEAFRAIDPALEEAGATAGLSWGRRFRRVLLPLAFPGLAAGAVLVYLFVMREIDAVALIPSGNRTVMFRIYNYIHFGRDSLIAALCLVSVAFGAVPVLAASLWRARKGAA